VYRIHDGIGLAAEAAGVCRASPLLALEDALAEHRRMCEALGSARLDIAWVLVLVLDKTSLTDRIGEVDGGPARGSGCWTVETTASSS